MNSEEPEQKGSAVNTKTQLELFVEFVNSNGEDGLTTEEICKRIDMKFKSVQNSAVRAVREKKVRRERKDNNYVYYPYKEGVVTELNSASKFAETVKKYTDGLSPKRYADEMNYTEHYANRIALEAYKKGLVEREPDGRNFVYLPIKQRQKTLMNYSDKIDEFFEGVGRDSVANVSDLQAYISGKKHYVDFKLRDLVESDNQKISIGKYVTEKVDDVPQGRWIIYDGTAYMSFGNKEVGYFQVKKSFLETAVEELDKGWFASRIELANSTKIPTPYKDIEKLSGFIISYLKKFGVEAKYESEKLLGSKA